MRIDAKTIERNAFVTSSALNDGLTVEALSSR